MQSHPSAHNEIPVRPASDARAFTDRTLLLHSCMPSKDFQCSLQERDVKA